MNEHGPLQSLIDRLRLESLCERNPLAEVDYRRVCQRSGSSESCDSLLSWKAKVFTASFWIFSVLSLWGFAFLL